MGLYFLADNILFINKYKAAPNNNPSADLPSERSRTSILARLKNKSKNENNRMNPTVF